MVVSFLLFHVCSFLKPMKTAGFCFTALILNLIMSTAECFHRRLHICEDVRFISAPRDNQTQSQLFKKMLLRKWRCLKSKIILIAYIPKKFKTQILHKSKEQECAKCFNMCMYLVMRSDFSISFDPELRYWDFCKHPYKQTS